MSAAIYLQARETTPTVARVVPVGSDIRVPIDAIVDGLLHESPDLRLDALAAAFVDSFRKPITLRQKIVIDPISEEIPLDLDE